MTFRDPRIGVTLYSFTRKFHQREFSLEGLLREVARRGLGPNVEIVGFQAIRNFPNVDNQYVSWFRGLFDELGLNPAAIGGNADGGIRRDRLMSNDEMVEYMGAQIKTAAKLGFNTMRVQYSLKPDDMERLLPLCEKENVRIGVEVHSHHTLHHPDMQAYLHKFQKLQTPFLGFTPDWGATMEEIPASLIQQCQQTGVPAAVIEYAKNYWRESMKNGPILDDRLVGEDMDKVKEDILALGGNDPSSMALVMNITALFGKGKAEDWAEMLPYAVHTHGKFYDVEPEGVAESVPMRKILAEYEKAGYNNAISMEWEGFHWNNWSDPFDMIESAQAKANQIVAGLRD
jgi:hypothetical protein